MDKARTLLLVEDEAIISLATSNRLQRWGYSVVTANSGEKAITLASAEISIDLILMDIDLGLGLSGPEAAERILAVRNVPIVFLTSHAEQDMVNKVRGITRYGYVLKDSGDFVLRSSLEMAFEMYAAQVELEKQLKRSNAILQSIPDMMFVVDREGYFRDFYANNAEASLALTPKDIIGNHLGSIFSPEVVTRHLRYYQDCLDSGEVQAFSYDLDLRDERHSFEVRIARQDNAHILAIVRDITSIMFAEAALAESEARFRTITNLSPMLIWESDTNSKCTFFNAKWLEYTGRTLEQELGRGWTEGIHPEDSVRVHRTFAKAYEGQLKFEMEYRLRKADGSYGWVSDKGSPKHNKDGSFSGYIGYCTEK